MTEDHTFEAGLAFDAVLDLREETLLLGSYKPWSSSIYFHNISTPSIYSPLTDFEYCLYSRMDFLTLSILHSQLFVVLSIIHYGYGRLEEFLKLIPEIHYHFEFVYMFYTFGECLSWQRRRRENSLGKDLSLSNLFILPLLSVTAKHPRLLHIPRLLGIRSLRLSFTLQQKCPSLSVTPSTE